MVTLTTVRTSNVQFDEKTIPRTCIFVGGTSGIGKFTLAELVSLGVPTKAYIMVRKASEGAMNPLLEELRRKNARADLRWIKGGVGSLAEVRRISDIVVKEASENDGIGGVDFVCMSAGYAPFGGRNNTEDDLDITHALKYYGRLLLTLPLLPLLRLSPSPRVLTILGSSMLSASLNISDMHLERPGAFGAIASQTQMSNVNTLFFDHPSSDAANARIFFIHNSPGAVDTGNMARYHVASWKSTFPLTTLLKPIDWVINISEQETGGRHVYIARSGKFRGAGPLVGDGGKEKGTMGREGGGLFILNHKCDVSVSDKALVTLRNEGQEEVVVKETMKILGPFL
ncbi:hypothetical protein EJ02DRAFT_415176 [Clathrospora elynae]|uniref:NAD(P)-binding protein n=1 Tax=Clathrospora elynae TaxID=706981 RepID=A0A6A5S596_9PLEO|nr:hypothetical protein EJ02DRAFT_415176 [Clathrospora elynae]